MTVTATGRELLSQRFRAFLELKFRDVRPTEESDAYKEELFGKLEESGDKYLKEGLWEEEAYRLAIRDLGPFGLKMIGYKKPDSKIMKILKGALRVFLWAAAYALVLTGIYLAVSFTTHAWDKTWIIWVDGVLGAVVASFIFLTILAINRKFYATSRVIICAIITLSVVATYLTFSVFTPGSWRISWMIFLFLPIILTGSVLICCLFTRSRATLSSFLAFIMVTSALLYVILGILGVMPWHPGWLLPALALIFDFVFAILSIKFRWFLGRKGAEKEEE